MSGLDKINQAVNQLGLGVPVAIRVSPRAQRLSLRVDAVARGVELVLPRRFATDTAIGFVARHRGWIAARVAAMPPPLRLADGATIPVFGVPHRIRRVTEASAATVTIGDGEIRVRGAPEHLPRRVIDHLKALARRDFAARARARAAELGKTVTRVGVRDPKSRWGSCSSKGTLSFSWRLVFAPEPVIEYVVAHEVAHLVEMNHSPRFWRVVATLVPDAAGPRAWLRRHRAELFSYG
ncbi:MAG TPA: SprT family zinc-dependent metalloprotease [Stellaceae bacterium]|jgi:predicted metal-dependent hydrolase|nr:SprT family zinc-dependent metalloprotease [Stellaceae bacterium]